MDNATTVLISLRIGNNWPLLELFRDKLKPPSEVIHHYLEPIVERAIRSRKVESERSTLDSDEEVGTFLDHLARNIKGT